MQTVWTIWAQTSAPILTARYSNAGVVVGGLTNVIWGNTHMTNGGVKAAAKQMGSVLTIGGPDPEALFNKLISHPEVKAEYERRKHVKP